MCTENFNSLSDKALIFREQNGSRFSFTQSKLITVSHADAINQLLAKTNYTSNEIDLIGFHGHTVFHNPAKKKLCKLEMGICWLN